MADVDANNRALRHIMAEYGLTRRETAELMMTAKSTVDRYLVPDQGPSYRRLPDHRLQLLKSSLRGRKKRS